MKKREVHNDPNKEALKTIEDLFMFVPPHELRKSINELFHFFIQHNMDAGISPQDYKKIAEDFYFLYKFLENAEDAYKEEGNTKSD
jgi:hypothetical protein